jgi:hypothetical protein
MVGLSAVRSVDLSADPMDRYSVDCLVDLLADQSDDYLVDCLVDLMVGSLVDPKVDLMADLKVVASVDLSECKTVAHWADYLVGPLAGRLVASSVDQ